MAVSGIMGLINLGLGEATLRFLAYYYGRNDIAGINRTLGATLSVYMGTAILGWAVMFFGATLLANFLALGPEDQKLGIELLRLTSFNIAAGLIYGVFASIPKALQRYDIDIKVLIAQSLFQASGFIVLIFAGFGVFAMTIWSILTLLFATVIYIIVARHLIPQIRLWPSLSREGLKEVFRYGIFALITKALGTIWGYGDRLILGSFVSTGAVAYLSVPIDLVFAMLRAITQAGAVLFPKFSATSDYEKRAQLYFSATWVMLCSTVILFAPATVLMPDFLRLWISADFALESAFVGQIIAASSMVRGAFIPYESLFRGLGKPEYVTKLIVLTSLTSLVANVILIPKFGLRGAGYSYCITPLWGILTIFITWRKVLRMPKIMPVVRIVLVPLLLGFANIYLALRIRDWLGVPENWVEFAGLGILFVSITVVTVAGCEMMLSGDSNQVRVLLSYIRSSLIHGSQKSCGTS
jgi:O-antigen/teichoic acid export membrane protein